MKVAVLMADRKLVLIPVIGEEGRVVGEKFFLLQRTGDVYSCPRGQSSDRFRFGNLFEEPVEELLDAGWKTIEAVENSLDLHEACARCPYLVYWQVYDNEPRVRNRRPTNDEVRGFYLIKPDGTKAPAWHYFHALLHPIASPSPPSTKGKTRPSM